MVLGLRFFIYHLFFYRICIIEKEKIIKYRRSNSYIKTLLIIKGLNGIMMLFTSFIFFQLNSNISQNIRTNNLKINNEYIFVYQKALIRTFHINFLNKTGLKRSF